MGIVFKGFEFAKMIGDAFELNGNISDFVVPPESGGTADLV